MLIDKPKTDEQQEQEKFNELVKKKAEEYGYLRHVQTPKDSKELEQLMQNLIFTIKQKDAVLAMQASKALAELTNFWALLNAESFLIGQSASNQCSLMQALALGIHLDSNSSEVNPDAMTLQNKALVIDDKFWDTKLKIAKKWVSEESTKGH